MHWLNLDNGGKGKREFLIFSATFLVFENDIWQVAVLTRCGGHVGKIPPMVVCSACGFGVEGAGK